MKLELCSYTTSDSKTHHRYGPNLDSPKLLDDDGYLSSPAAEHGATIVSPMPRPYLRICRYGGKTSY